MVSAVSSPNPSSFPLDAEEVADLRSTLHGDAYLPSDDGYADAIAAWSLLVRHTPALAVMPETAADIARAVAFAAAHDLPVGVMGTGHGQPTACDAGVLVNTSRMRGVAIDSEAGIARVEPGAKWADVIPVAQEYGLAPLNGSSSDVGVVGYTLGGGHGWLARAYGRAADRIVAADLVLASGEQVRVTAESDPELFWALKGGGGNFGIVTALEFGLVPVSEVYGGSVLYPLTEAREVLQAFSRWSPTLPAAITASVDILRLPPLPDLPPVLQGAAVIAVRACAIGDLAAGEALIAPMRSLAAPVMDTFGVMPYAAIDAISMDPVDPLPVIGMTMMLRDLDAETIEAILAVAGPEVTSPLLLIDIRDLRPAPGQAPAADTRSHLDGLPVYIVAIPMSEEMAQGIEEAMASVRASLAPHAAERVVFNFLGDGDSGPERTRAAFPAEAWERLREVKRRHDPGNRFRFNHNIAP